jgi:hypothetical protein
VGDSIYRRLAHDISWMSQPEGGKQKLKLTLDPHEFENHSVGTIRRR